MSFLEIKNMSKKYKSQIVLDNVSINLPSKGLLSLIGESGGGKSTFLNCLIGIEKMDKGNVYFQNKKIKNFEKFRNRYIGMIYQNINLISFLNVKKNITLKGRKNIVLIEKLKIDKLIKRKVNSLSLGEGQRVALTRALSSNCKILLCDEPTGSLDKGNAKIVMELLKEISKNILVLIVSHNLDLVNKYSDYILKIKNGKIISPIINDKKEPVFREKLSRLKLSDAFFVAFNTLIKNKMKVIISLLSLSITFSFLLISYSASSNISLMINNNKHQYLDYSLLRIVKEKTNKIENTSLTLIKEERLNKEDIIELNYLIDLSSYMYDLTPIFTYYPTINCPINSDNYFSNIEFLPYMEEDETRFKNKIDGRFPENDKEVIVNKACRKYFQTTRFNINIEKQIDLKLDNNEVISDTYNVDINFNIVGQVEEFDLLETPKIYYPYNFLKKLSKEIVLDNLSSYYKTPITLFDRLSTLSGEEDTFQSSYYYVYIEDVLKVDEIYERINSITKENQRYKILNSNINKIHSFQTIFDSIEIVLNIFVSITLLISILLMCLTLFSYVLDYKKDIGIMLGCGVLKKDINLIFAFQSIIVCLFSLSISILIYQLVSSKINSYLSLLIGINVLSNSLSIYDLLYFIFISLVISLVCSFFTTKKISSMNIASILRED